MKAERLWIASYAKTLGSAAVVAVVPKDVVLRKALITSVVSVAEADAGKGVLEKTTLKISRTCARPLCGKRCTGIAWVTVVVVSAALWVPLKDSHCGETSPVPPVSDPSMLTLCLFMVTVVGGGR